MTPHQTLAVAVRLFAIWLAVYTMRTLPVMYMEGAGAGNAVYNFVSVGLAILMVLLVLFLWFFPKSVARNLLATETVSTRESSSPDTWLAVGCALLGLWLLVPAITGCIYNLSVLYRVHQYPAIETMDLHISWIYHIAEIAFGIWLLLGARGARKLFWWARGAGR